MSLKIKPIAVAASLSVMISVIPLVSAVPLSNENNCADSAADCQASSQSPSIGVDKITKEAKDEKLPRDVFELLGSRFVNLDVVKVLDQKTVATLNTAVYPMKKGKSLIESYVEKAYSGRTGGSSGSDTGDWSGGGFSGGHKFGSTRNRSWVDTATYRPTEPRKTRNAYGAETDDEEEQSWVAKSSSTAEYVAVFILCLGFWLWFRQSRSY